MALVPAPHGKAARFDLLPTSRVFACSRFSRHKVWVTPAGRPLPRLRSPDRRSPQEQILAAVSAVRGRIAFLPHSLFRDA